MNIFATSTDPVECARALDDKRLIKMILETAQILCSALANMNCPTEGLYKPTHRNHPCVRWAGAARGNFNWLVLHGLALNEEYKFRYQKNDHKSTSVILSASEVFSKHSSLDVQGMTPFANCTNITGNLPVCKTYQLYMVQSKWDDKTTWTRRGRPNWVESKKEGKAA